MVLFFCTVADLELRDKKDSKYSPQWVHIAVRRVHVKSASGTMHRDLMSPSRLTIPLSFRYRVSLC